MVYEGRMNKTQRNKTWQSGALQRENRWKLACQGLVLPYLLIVHIFIVEGHNVVEHEPALAGRTIGIHFFGLKKTTDGLTPPGLFHMELSFQIRKGGMITILETGESD